MRVFLHVQHVFTVISLHYSTHFEVNLFCAEFPIRIYPLNLLVFTLAVSIFSSCLFQKIKLIAPIAVVPGF
jgi:hypothetical protein